MCMPVRVWGQSHPFQAANDPLFNFRHYSYSVNSDDRKTQPPRFFWGKLEEQRMLPLHAHCLDVALCFRALCELPGIRRALEQTAGRRLGNTDLDRLAVLALLHDLGKANLGFQRKPFDEQAPRAGHVRELAPLFQEPDLAEPLMAALQWQTIGQWFADEAAALGFFLATFSHHGRPLRFDGERTGTARVARRWWQADGQRDPMSAIAELIATARRAFPDAFGTGDRPLPDAPAFQHRFAGLVMLADWLGSHPHWFPIEQVDVEQRLAADRETVPRLLRAVGLDPRQFPLTDAPFAARFAFPPRPLQARIDGLDPDDNTNRLLIAESETGSGKTEAALHWFGRLLAAGRVDGLYFALPTRVAARELYRRVVETIQCWYPNEQARPITVLAVPGYAEVDGLPAEQVLPDAEQGNRWIDEADQRRRERHWAAEHPKRFLAASVAVGTIDQALLSVVQTAHAHLRSVCLDRTLLVVDEVHASDTYMSRLLEHLLRHHLGTGGHALLLSATLGSAARSRYLDAAGAAVTPPSLDEAIAAPYPALNDASGRLVPCARTEGPGKTVRFEPLTLAERPERLAERLVDALRQGARVLMVMNTVTRANDLLRALEERDDFDPAWLFAIDGVRCPHHGRFAPDDRAVLDRAVSDRLGKGSPAGPLLLIGTQTLEQSLDIDADLLVSDLAPADVLLQRVGRLHRHERERPAGFGQARCLLLIPDKPLIELLDDSGKVSGGYRRIGYGSVYPDLRILALTLDAIREPGTIEVPRDNRWLVEQATHPEQLAQLDDPRWQRHGQAVTGEELMQALQAGSATANFNLPFGQFGFNEMGGKVATRLGADNWRLPLDRPAESPFGQRLRNLTIPDHMAAGGDEETLTVERADRDGLTLRWGDTHYRYTRFGLEKEDA